MDLGVGQGHRGHSFFCDCLSVPATPFVIFWIRPCHLQLMNILPFISHLFTLVKDSKFLTGLVITKRINQRVIFTDEIVLYNFQQTLRKFTQYSPALPRNTIFPDLEKNCVSWLFPRCDKLLSYLLLRNVPRKQINVKEGSVQQG